MPVPAAPTGLTVTARSPSQVILRWTDNATDETGYVIERKQGAGAFARLRFMIDQTPSYEDVILPAGTTYYHDGRALPSTNYTWRVKAINGSGDSSPSNEVTLTMAAYAASTVRDRTLPLMYANDTGLRADLIARSGATVNNSAAYIVCDIGISQGVTTEGDIVTRVAAMRARGIEPVGYIATNRGTETADGAYARTVAATKTYVDQWSALGVWSIFLDEGGRYHPNTDSTPAADNTSVSPTPSYYEQMFQYIVERTPGGGLPAPRVFVNAAQYLPDDWAMGVADVVNVFEDTGTVWNNDSTGPGTYVGSSGSAWSPSYPKDRLVAIVHTHGSGATDLAAVQSAVSRLAPRGIGNFFVSYRSGGFAYFSGLPEAPYWPLVEVLVSGAPIMPAITTAIAFATDPGAASPTWADVTSYVEGFHINRGRQYETDQISAGTATVVLDNRDRRFDTEYTGGPYGSNVKVLRRLKVEATWNAVLYTLFDGYIESYEPVIAPDNSDAWVVVSAVDGVEVLSNAIVDGSFAQQRTDVRIGAILDAISWPAAARDLGTGLIDTQAVTLTDANAWQHLQQIVGDEYGVLFLSSDGKVTFQDRYARLRPDVTSLLTIGDLAGGGELAVDIGFAKDRTRIINRAAVTRQGGTQQITSNSASITNYFRRAVSRSGLHSNDGEAYGLAGFLSERYAQPQLRAKAVLLHYADDPTTMWPHILGREIGDRITLARTPPGGGSAINQSVTIEGVRYRWVAAGDDWQEMAWTVSPNDTNQYWVLNDATYGVLSSTTRLAP